MDHQRGPVVHTVESLLRDAVKRLQETGVDTPALDAEVMLGKAAGISRTRIFTHPEFRPNQLTVDMFLEWVERRSRREPLAYIIGEREFYGLPFEVTPDVLIPRPETEFLVEAAVELIKDIPNPKVLDIGLGSGAIAVSIARSVPDVFVYGTETSPGALEVALRNAQLMGVHDRVEFLAGDLFDPIPPTMRFAVIVSNPPYIPSGEIDSLQPEVADYEPRAALDGGPDGLDYYRRISPVALGYLEPGGTLAVEVGIGQSTTVAELFRESGLVDVRMICDYGRVERVVLGKRSVE